MKFLAHIRNENGIRVEQSLKDHCIQTARYAAESISGSGLENTAFLSGLLHDMGKAKQTFMDYLEAGYCGKEIIRGSVNHTFAGVIYILEKYHEDRADAMACLTSEMIACAIGGHHGIFDCAGLDGNNGFSHRLQKDKNEIDYDESVTGFFAEVAEETTVNGLFRKAVDEVNNLFRNLRMEWNGDPSKVWFQIGMGVRLLQSAVIYADRRDTREFMTGVIRESDKAPDWETQRIFLEKKLNDFPEDTKINKARRTISNQCRDFSDRPCGIYQLDVPTGGGKTLATLRYALNHAERYNKKRIIFIIPLLSVLDQNAQVIREYISDQDIILEHHSNVVRELEDGESLDPYETMMDDWHSPIIISTLVQFLNILFKDKTSAIGRMQALCDSVIVIDEVQSLPLKTTAMFNMALNFLSRFCHTTVVLSSATLPGLDALKGWPLKLAEDPDMVHLNKEELGAFSRAEIINDTTPYGMSLEECVDFCLKRINDNSSLLVICNTKREARMLFERMEEAAEDDWHIFHLSTSMCQAHRVETLKEIRKELSVLQKNNKENPAKKVVCISTQLVEAGVDFSFECVIRVLAGIDNLAQAAGRCNRSNEYNHSGKVYLINLKGENLGMISEISRGQDCTRKVLTANPDLTGDELIGKESSAMYYKALFQYAGNEIKYPFKEDGNTLYMADMLANNNPYAKDRTYVLRQPFKTMGKKFQVFDDDTIDVLVPYGRGMDLIEELRSCEERNSLSVDFGYILEQSKLYTISIFDYQKKRLEENGLLYSVCENRMLILDKSMYHDQYGLGDIEEPDVEHFII